MIANGQPISRDFEGNIVTHIKTLFVSAGIKYGFPKNCAGISLNDTIVRIAEAEGVSIKILFGKNRDPYIIKPERIREIVKEYKSVYWKGNTKLLVFPMRELTRVKE